MVCTARVRHRASKHAGATGMFQTPPQKALDKTTKTPIRTPASHLGNHVLGVSIFHSAGQVHCPLGASTSHLVADMSQPRKDPKNLRKNEHFTVKVNTKWRSERSVVAQQNRLVDICQSCHSGSLRRRALCSPRSTIIDQIAKIIGNQLGSPHCAERATCQVVFLLENARPVVSRCTLVIGPVCRAVEDTRLALLKSKKMQKSNRTKYWGTRQVSSRPTKQHTQVVLRLICKRAWLQDNIIGTSCLLKNRQTNWTHLGTPTEPPPQAVHLSFLSAPFLPFPAFALQKKKQIENIFLTKIKERKEKQQRPPRCTPRNGSNKCFFSSEMLQELVQQLRSKKSKNQKNKPFTVKVALRPSGVLLVNFFRFRSSFSNVLITCVTCYLLTTANFANNLS